MTAKYKIIYTINNLKYKTNIIKLIFLHLDNLYYFSSHKVNLVEWSMARGPTTQILHFLACKLENETQIYINIIIQQVN